ncbi:hypothetical protein HMN09_01142200 [Mycena chlorophos]|uniref:Uncharacterized protein n=1 Tax=Mycena chlorophos TaxID=658473 RepID=A0A8H6VXT5_MYCCL|nr:hypothetical protein HMN09_01142200 [Mycena chlorophos]
MAAPTHFRSIFFQGAPEIFGAADRTRRDGLVNALIAATHAKYDDDVRVKNLKSGQDPNMFTTKKLINAIDDAKDALIAFDNEFGAAAIGRQVATKQRVADWVAGVQAALTQFVVPGPAPENIAAANTLYIASIPEFGLNGYVDAAASGAAVQTISLLVDPSGRKVAAADPWLKIGGISQITVITSDPATPTKQIPKTQFVDADSWQTSSFTNMFPANYASDPRPARLRFEVPFPGGTVALGFSTCADAGFEKHEDVNLCVYLAGGFPMENFADSLNSFVLNDQRSKGGGNGTRDVLFRAGFYHMYNEATLPATWRTDPQRLENILRTMYASYPQPKDIPPEIVADAKKTKTQTWKYCYYEGLIDPNNHFFPPGPPPGPVICRPSEWILIPQRTP